MRIISTSFVIHSIWLFFFLCTVHRLLWEALLLEILNKKATFQHFLNTNNILRPLFQHYPESITRLLWGFPKSYSIKLLQRILNIQYSFFIIPRFTYITMSKCLSRWCICITLSISVTPSHEIAMGQLVSSQYAYDILSRKHSHICFWSLEVASSACQVRLWPLPANWPTLIV